jgi:hypothetical protein
MQPERPSSGHEELAISVRGTRRISNAIITVMLSTLGSGGVTYGLTQAERNRSETDRRMAENAAAGTETDMKLLRDRVCTLERELVAEAKSRVSLSAADAERVKTRKAQAASIAVERFKDAARDWPCPTTAEDRESRTRRPLWKRAQSALPGTVPEWEE